MDVIESISDPSHVNIIHGRCEVPFVSGYRFVWELLAPERPNADVCKKAHAASDV